MKTFEQFITESICKEDKPILDLIKKMDKDSSYAKSKRGKSIYHKLTKEKVLKDFGVDLEDWWKKHKTNRAWIEKTASKRPTFEIGYQEVKDSDPCDNNSWL